MYRVLRRINDRPEHISKISTAVLIMHSRIDEVSTFSINSLYRRLKNQRTLRMKIP